MKVRKGGNRADRPIAGLSADSKRSLDTSGAQAEPNAAVNAVVNPL
jgi:hypothetical protein